MVDSDRSSSVVLAAILALTLLTAVFSARELAALKSASMSGLDRVVGLQRSAALSPRNWRYQLELAQLSAAVGRQEDALTLYTKALTEFPACGICWIGLAETRDAMGHDPFAAIANASRFGRSITTVRTRAAVLQSKHNRHQAAASEFSAALGGRAKDEKEFLLLLTRIYPTDFILREIVTDAEIASFFDFARAHLPVEDVDAIWERHQKVGVSIESRRGFVAYLLRRGYVRKAWRVESGEASITGRIDREFVASSDHGLFGWRFDDAPGMRTRIVSNPDRRETGRVLRLKFDGEHNVDSAGASLIVPVVPTAVYMLRLRVRRENVTSAEGPRVVVKGVAAESGPSSNCRFHAQTNDFRLSGEWMDVALPMEIPRECEGIRVLVGRFGTRRLNRFISGTAWFDGFRLEFIQQPVDENPGPSVLQALPS